MRNRPVPRVLVPDHRIVILILRNLRDATPYIANPVVPLSAILVLLEPLAHCPEVGVEDIGLRLLVVLTGQHGVLYRVHAAHARAIALMPQIPRPRTLDVRHLLRQLMVRWTLEMAVGGAGGIDEPLVLHAAYHVRQPAIAVMCENSRVEWCEPHRHYDRAHAELHLFVLHLEVNGVLLAQLLARSAAVLRELEAHLRVYRVHGRYSLREVQVNRLSLRQPQLERVRRLAGALFHAAAARRTEILPHVTGLLVHRYGEVTALARQADHVAVRHYLDPGMSTDIQHLGRQDSDRAIVRREGLVELGHHPADTRPALDEVDLGAHVRQIQRRLHAGYAATYHEHILSHVFSLPWLL